MYAAVNLTPTLFTTNAQTSELKVKGDSNVFTGLLAQMMTNSVTQSTDNSTEGADTSKLMSEIFTMLLNGASTEDITEKLSGLTNEQKLSLIETADEILTFICQPEMSDNDKIQNILSMLEDKKEKTDIGLIYQILAMMGVNVQEVKANSAQDNAQTQVNVTVTVSTNSVQDITQSMIPQANMQVSETTQATESTQQTDFSKISEMLNKLVDAAKQSQSLPSDVKVVSNNITDGNTEFHIAHARQKIYTSTENEVKSAKGSTEFDDIIAYAQQSKNIQQATPQNVVQAKVEIPVQNQVADSIINQLNTDINTETKELTLMLKPQELGEVAIKLVKNDGEITISIMAQNSATEKLLAEKLPTLVSNLQAINGQVKDVMIVNPNESASSFLGQFNLSQSDSGTQYQQRQTTSNTYSGNSQSIAEENTQQDKEFVREGQLWQTV